MQVRVQHFFGRATSTLTYVIWDAETRDAVIIDPVLDFDSINLSFSEESMSKLLRFVEEHELKVHFVLETHIHADHITAAHRLRERLGLKVVAGNRVPEVQALFADMLALPEQDSTGAAFDLLLADGETVAAGSLEIKGIQTPGHTPACLTYRIGDALFTGDSIFMPDFGTGRCDFPAGSSAALFDSVVNKLYGLPDATRVFVGHDYQPEGRELAFETTIGACKESNKQLRADTDRDQFVTWRKERDDTLDLPRLIFQSVQLNINAGQLPPPATNGTSYLKIPVLSAGS